jgi:hypothetical protein
MQITAEFCISFALPVGGRHGNEASNEAKLQTWSIGEKEISHVLFH